MGATCAVFKDFFGNQGGMVVTIGIKLAWAVNAPLLVSKKI
jgi:hypothetical protein